MSAQIQIGQQVKVDGTTLTVAWVGKEVKLEAKDGTIVWRHSRTIAKLLEQQQAKPRRQRASKTLDETLLDETKNAEDAAAPASA